MSRVKAVRYTGTGDSISAAKAVLNCWLADEWRGAVSNEYCRYEEARKAAWFRYEDVCAVCGFLSKTAKDAWEKYMLIRELQNQFYQRNLP